MSGTGRKRAAPASPQPVRLLALLNSGQKLFLSGNLLDARDVYEQAYRRALNSGHPTLAARFLNNLGACHVKLFQYRQALDAFLQSRNLAREAGDSQTQGISSVNISALYLQMGDVETAATVIEGDLRRLSQLAKPEYRARLLLQLGTVRIEQKRPGDSIPVLLRAVEEADRGADVRSVAAGFDRIGLALLQEKKLAEAEAYFVEAFRIRKLNRLDEGARSLRNLATLKIAQGDLATAATLADRAVEMALAQPALASPWTIYHLRGRIHRARGRLPEALNDFRAALDLTRRFRLDALPADSIRVLTDVRLDEIYASFVETAALVALDEGRPNLAREAFEAAEENRSASLRALLAEPEDWRARLPAAYWQALARTHAAEAAVLRSDNPGARSQLNHMRAALLEMEYKARSNRPLEPRHFVRKAQDNLDAGTALFGFHLGEATSFLWAVTDTDFRLYRLPPAAWISARTMDFERAISNGDPTAVELGDELYRSLFGGVAPHILLKPRWLLALDTQLFRLPFAALVTGTAGGRPAYLVERHAVQIIPGVLGWKRPDAAVRLQRFSGRFIGVGDSIYNRADPRWRELRGASAITAGLPRLVASRREIESCSRAWNAATSPLLLTGSDAVKAGIRKALAADSAVVHFAVHVIQTTAGPGSGLIHLVVSPSGPAGSELLSPVEISAWRINGGLIVVNGCSSGAAPDVAAGSGPRGRSWLAAANGPQVLPGNELNRLTRAWLAAGADAVAATRWASPDEDGRLFVSLYRHLRQSPDPDPAQSLRHAQLEMLASGSWASNPSYWASFFLVGS